VGLALDMKNQNKYQIALIVCAFLVVCGIVLFAYRELFPEYKKFQSVYIKLERLRAKYRGAKPPPPFEKGIKQVVIPDPDNGPEIIDRCTSCHVALDLPHFSKTRPKRDVNGVLVRDDQGRVVLEENPDYIWNLPLPEIQQLHTMKIGGQEVDMTRVLSMHPLIGTESRPFEFHPIEEYGCTSCHSGNGRSLVARRAHGPLYAEHESHGPKFLEEDPKNDPRFAMLYNEAPSHDLAFQTTPLLVGPLMVAKCMQCHLSSDEEAAQLLQTIREPLDVQKKSLTRLQKGVEEQRAALISYVTLYLMVQGQGLEGTLLFLNQKLQDDRLSASQIDLFEAQYAYVKRFSDQAAFEANVEKEIAGLIGSDEAAQTLLKGARVGEPIESLVGGALKKKIPAAKQSYQEFERAQVPLTTLLEVEKRVLDPSVENLTYHYERGRQLFLSQACWSCHRIAGYARGGVGPELTTVGLSYPWEVKEHIVWPQGHLPSSTMPNFRLDHQELEDLMSFLMAQTGTSKVISEVDRKRAISQWEAGTKSALEKPISPTMIHNIENSMKIFATEGCAACHKLQGFESNQFVKEGKRDWFLAHFPEQILGSELSSQVQEQADVIDANILQDDQNDQIIERLQAEYPGLVEGFYSNFRFAARAQKDEAYQERLNRVLMIYIQEYGFGRDIAPRLNFSGVARDTAWLMGHFKNPAQFSPKSIMPAFAFDESKFYALTYMLQTLGQRNLERLQKNWQSRGFSPREAYQTLCASCHGEQKQGNGVIADWIYPIPKNLSNPEFLCQLTKEEAEESIEGGVSGTPMAPWEDVLSEDQIKQLVDWIFKDISDAQCAAGEQKWGYEIEDIEAEIGAEGSYFEERENGEFIKKRFFTPQNLKEGKALYMDHCAVCHANEGTGSTERAATMVEAKPRMFTNLLWARGEDDLELLRAIKYGVQGTSMPAWGDQTTAWQRMQVLMYIRTLLGMQQEQLLLSELLYTTFDTSIEKVNEARIEPYTKIDALQAKVTQLELSLLQDELSSEQGGAIYSELLTEKKALAKAQAGDEKYTHQIELIREQKKLFEVLGLELILLEPADEVIADYFELVQLAHPVYGEPLTVTQTKERVALMEEAVQKIVKVLDAKIEQFTPAMDALKPDVEDARDLKKLEAIAEKQGPYINFKTKLQAMLVQSRRLTKQQLENFKNANAV